MDTLTTPFLAHEARALLTRLARIRPFALSEAMVPAANLSPAAQRAIEQHLARGREQLRGQAQSFIAWLHGSAPPAALAQRRFALLRLRFNAVLTQFDLFADALSQRSDRDQGIWMAGLDALAADALALPGVYDSPPVVCYLDRGIGAAIRRARTRLPGGGDNPAAIIRVPRERMVGGGVAGSLVHEVGHQAAALLGLMESLRPVLEQRRAAGGADTDLWHCWSRWISEIVADLWSVARLGAAATLGLIGVLSLPRPFVFRITLADPHPAPWLRVLLSCGLGQALYPAAHWRRLAGLWQALYPLQAAPAPARALLQRLAAGIDGFVALLLQHRPPALAGRTLGRLLAAPQLQPQSLAQRFDQWRLQPAAMFDAAPCLACAVLGQARLQERLSPEQESRCMARLLTHWALHNALGPPDAPAAAPRLPRIPSTVLSTPTLTEGGRHGYH
jgi:hypothetical protein